MNKSLFAAAAFILASAALHAETYDGVLAVASVNSRAAVQAEAVKAASAPDQNVAPGSRGPEAFVAIANPAVVREQAIIANYAPDQNVSAGSRFNSRVVSTMENPAIAQLRASKQVSR